MAVQFKAPPKSSSSGARKHTIAKIILAVFLGLVTISLAVLTYYGNKYNALIDNKLQDVFLAHTSMIFAAPRTVAIGDDTKPAELAAALRRAGYTEAPGNRLGHYAVKENEIDVYPGPDSYFNREDGVIKFGNGKVLRIISLADNTERNEYSLEPELVSNLFDKNREKRRLVRYEDIPQLLVDAVVSIEDKRFFHHGGFDPLRMVRAAYVDVRQHRYAEGASTLSQQLARGLLLNNDKTWRRKLPELFFTEMLEHKLSKQKIFEDYANLVPLGHRGSFGIRGFGEASQVFFGKEIGHLTLPEAATLAGLIQQPSYTNPFRWPDRARTRRNVVLKAMLDNEKITQDQYREAVESPLSLARHGTESTDAPYFVDLVNDALNDKFQDYDFQTNTFRIYTTIDLQLQRDATEAVRMGMEEVDKLIKPRRKKDPNYPDPQCALIALDPTTGEVKALIGGRNYGTSQLDRILAKRSPGSSFKPFVYAAALNTGLNGGTPVLTAATIINDEPTTFWFDGKPYEPNNFHHELMGEVSMRKAIAHSLNIPTVKLAEQIGYAAVVDVARRAGLNGDIRPTPAMALGAYEVTPLEIAGAYTLFANKGILSKPYFIANIQRSNGESVFEAKPERRQALDPRVTFLMDSLLEEVLRSGTGAGVHARGINFIAAGKTGTSDHDGWFAGFTSRLLCVVWVGFDDNRDLNIEGAKSALPVWAEFMRRAHEHRQYKNVTDFTAPAGIVSAQIDPVSGLLATTSCPTVRTEFFIEGTQPVESCAVHGGGVTRVAGWDTTPDQQPAAAAPAVSHTPLQAGLPPAHPNTGAAPVDPNPNNPNNPNAPKPPEKKKGLFNSLRNIFK